MSRVRRNCLFWCVSVFLAVVFVPCFPSWSVAYEAAEVIDGGTVSGRVTLADPVPPARIFHLILFPNLEFCSTISDGRGNRLLREFQAGPDGGFSDVIVALVGVEKGKPFTGPPELRIRDCRMSPFVSAVRQDEPIRLVNEDPITHDVQGYTLKGPYTFPMFNKPLLPESETEKKIRFRPGHYLFRSQCGVHAFMQSWGMAVTNPYYAVTPADGGFKIDQIPTGRYHLIAWHPLMPVQAREVTIEAGGAASMDFEFNAADVSIPLHDLQEGYRFDTVLLPHQINSQPAQLQAR